MFFLFIFFHFSWASQGNAQCLSEDIIPNKYIVRLKNSPEVSLQSLALGLAEAKTRFKVHGLKFKTIFPGDKRQSSPKISKMGILDTPPSLAVEVNSSKELESLRSDGQVDTIEPDCKVHLTQNLTTQPSTGEDPLLSQQWALTKIEAPKAWTMTRGSQDITVAISDTGIDYLHSDLSKNMWVNPREIPNNGVDDDDNGCIDDIYGCNLAEQTGDPMPASSNKELSHGTHVAGIIGAVGNNGIGISGVAQNVRLMAAKGFTNNLDGDESILLQSIYYSVNNGARIINCSWARLGTPLKAEIDAFNYAYNHGVIVINAAGNSQMDSSGFSPSSLSTVITVGATDNDDGLARFSNWGKIDLLAPGGKGFDSSGIMLDPILSTLPRSNGNYGNFIGTSMAAPFVSGLAALILSINPKFTPSDVLKILQSGADKVRVSNSKGTSFDYLRINAANSVSIAQATKPTDIGGYLPPECRDAETPCGSLSNSSETTSKAISGCGFVLGSINKNGTGNPRGPSAVLFLVPPIALVFLRLRSKTNSNGIIY